MQALDGKLPCNIFVDSDGKSYESSFSEEGEVDGNEEYCSDDEPPEPIAECTFHTRLNTTGMIGRISSRNWLRICF